MQRFRVTLAVLASLTAFGAQAQVSNLPNALQETLSEIGPAFQNDYRAAIPATRSAFLPLLRAAPKAGVAVTFDQSYGPDAKQVLDVYEPARRLASNQVIDVSRPTTRTGVPVLVFIHGGAYVIGDKNLDREIYANVGYWFARQGIVTLNANYRLAPDAKWPGAVDDLRAIVAWARENAERLGGDPSRIFLMGHSAGATHVAGYVFDPALQPSAGPGIAGAVLVSGRYRVHYDPADPNGQNVRAYFGDDPADYPKRSPISHVRDGSKVPVFVVMAEYENPGLDVRGAELIAALCERDSACPRFMRMLGHNHESVVAAFNTADEQLGRETLDFMQRGR